MLRRSLTLLPLLGMLTGGVVIPVIIEIITTLQGAGEKFMLNLFIFLIKRKWD